MYDSYGKKMTRDYIALGIPCRKSSGIVNYSSQALTNSLKLCFFHLFLEYTWNLIVIVIYFFHKSMLRQFLKKKCFLNIYIVHQENLSVPWKTSQIRFDSTCVKVKMQKYILEIGLI